MTEYDPKTKIWSHKSDSSKDVVPMGSYIGEALFKRFREADSHKIVEINGDTLEKWTIGNIHHGTIIAAKNLQELGIGPDDKLAFFSRFNSKITSIVCACYTLGIPFCPLDVMNYDLDYIFNYLQPTILLCDLEFSKEIDESLDRINYKLLKHKLVVGDNADNVLFNDQRIDDFAFPKFTKSPDEHLACLMLTSGTTGTPKLVQLSHSLLVHVINTLKHSIFNSPEDILVGTAGIRWISHINRMFCSIFFDCPQVYSGKNPDPQNICEIIEKTSGTSLIAPNSFLQILLEYYKKNKNLHNLSSLERILSGGEAPLKAVNDKWKQEFPNLKIIKGYGLTEMAGLVALNNNDCPQYINGGAIYPGFEVKVVSLDGQNQSPEQNGIVYIKLRAPFLGYYNRPEDNRKSFTPDGWFITGDYGKMTDRYYLHIHCRFKDILRSKGNLLIPNLLEDFINQHPLVNLGAVVGIGADRILIFIKLLDGEDSSAIEYYLRKEIDFEFVEKVLYLDKFKFISTGKVDKDEMKQGYLQGKYV